MDHETPPPSGKGVEGDKGQLSGIKIFRPYCSPLLVAKIVYRGY
jgi:hypothetical protein